MLPCMSSRHLAVCSWSLKPENPKELVSMVQQCEINAVQLALLPLIHNPNWTNAAEIIADAGITIVSGMLEASGEDYTSLETIAKTGGLRQEAMWESTIENTKRVANSAAEIGIPLVTFHAGFIPEERCNERSKMLDHLHMMTEVCIDCGKTRIT